MVKFKNCCRHKHEFINALHCPTRWEIINILAKEKKTTSEIQQHLKRRTRRGHKTRGHGQIFGPNMYYHLSALKKAGLIKIAGYKEEKGGAPEKIWQLKNKKITIDLTDCDCQ